MPPDTRSSELPRWGKTRLSLAWLIHCAMVQPGAWRTTSLHLPVLKNNRLGRVEGSLPKHSSRRSTNQSWRSNSRTAARSR